MKFKRRQMKIKSKIYKLYEIDEVPKQLRIIYSVNDRSSILGNSKTYCFLHELFLLIASLKEENAIFIVKDTSAKKERFMDWYDGAEFHKNVMLFNFEKTQISVKDFNRLLKMSNYVKSNIVDLKVPKYDFKKIKNWNLNNVLVVKNHGKWLLLSSNYAGYNYMSREASYFVGMEDDPEEFFAHAHLFHLTKLEDKLDFRYFY